jgi:RNA polymerase sigma-70 factor, ECF subfamily
MLAAVPSLRAFAISLSGNVDRADDLVQETLLRAITNCSARNTASDAAKSKTPTAVDTLKSTPEQHSRVEFEEFRVALAMLPSDQREALLLVGASGFSYEEAAAICESAVGTIKSRVNRAHAALEAPLHRQRRQVQPGSHDACRSDRGRARLI